jgi:aryl-alcohol dehydrogenase-like predicted oxidoreductase
MEYRELGCTGIMVSNLSFGASSLGGVFHPVSEKEGIKTVLSAVDYGINLIDCSPYYGDLKAEKVLGTALKQISRDQVFISTKVGRYWLNGQKHWDYSANTVMESVDASLQRLHLDYIDIIHCHDIEFADLNQIVEETLPALHRLKESGKVRYVGITGLPLENFRYVIDRASPGMVEMILTFCHYTLQDDSLTDYLDYFKKYRIGVINASPLGMGLLTTRGVPEWHPASPEIQNACQKAAQFCKDHGEKIEKLAIQFSTHLENIPTTLVSTANEATIIQNIQWTSEPMNNDLLQKVLALLKSVHRNTWKNS